MATTQALCTLNSVYPVGISKNEHKYIDNTFKECSKPSHQKETARRNDDVGYEAALKCLSRQFVTDGPEQAKFTAAKIAFIQNMMNQNIAQDANIKTQTNGDRIDIINAKADAKAKVLPGQTELVSATGSAIKDNIAEAGTFIEKVSTGKSLNILS